jgi:hypothetical protein
MLCILEFALFLQIIAKSFTRKYLFAVLAMRRHYYNTTRKRSRSMLIGKLLSLYVARRTEMHSSKSIGEISVV